MSSFFFVEFLSLAGLASLVLVPLSWIALYWRGAEARDLIFWALSPWLYRFWVRLRLCYSRCD